MRIIIMALALGLVGCIEGAQAFVYGGSNLSFMGYPKHNCDKPIKPIKPYYLDSQWEIDSYNEEVEYYNSQLQEYLDCIEEYVDNANNDIKRIQQKAREAIDEASTDY